MSRCCVSDLKILKRTGASQGQAFVNNGLSLTVSVLEFALVERISALKQYDMHCFTFASSNTFERDTHFHST